MILIKFLEIEMIDNEIFKGIIYPFSEDRNFKPRLSVFIENESYS